MKWIEVKMKELGVTGENSTNLERNGFKILAFMDYTAMISVTTEKYGTIDCKPLGVLWQSELMQVCIYCIGIYLPIYGVSSSSPQFSSVQLCENETLFLSFFYCSTKNT